jgi:hypothetical protein
MTVLVAGYEHRGGEHCASTSLRNILHFHGVEISEAMIVGLSSGLGFYYLCSDQLSPTRIFHGRTATLESDFCENTGIPFEDRLELDDERAWVQVRDRIDAGQPVMISTDTYYLGYHNTGSHFPRHRVVVVGYDDSARTALLADRKFSDYQPISYDELRRARNADDYPMSCLNQYGDFLGEVKLGIPLVDAIRIALGRNADWMLAESPEALTGTKAMRRLAADFNSWQSLEDWSWAARFGYQVIIKRGSGGSFFRSMYADFLAEAAELVPAIGTAGLPGRMSAIAARWRELAAVLEEQSEGEVCRPELFSRAGAAMEELANAEESFFREARELTASEAAWSATQR